jgi:hypothetical protein
MVGFDLTDSGFWVAIVVGLISVAGLVYWVITGARKPR